MYQIRKATLEDIPQVLYFIKQIAIYEKMEDQVIATEETLKEWMFNKKISQSIIISVDGKDIGFALYFNSPISLSSSFETLFSRSN